MSGARRLRVLAMVAAVTAGSNLGAAGCDGDEFPPCPPVDSVRNGDFRFFSSEGTLSDEEFTMATVTIDDDGFEIRYQRPDEAAPWVIRYWATNQVPEPAD